MAFPTVVNQATTNTAVAPASMTMPTFSVGNLLLVNVGFLANATSGSISSGSGGTWTLVGSDNVGSTTWGRVYGKIAQTGDTFAVDNSVASQGFGGFVTSFSGWSGNIADIGFAGATGAINPPNLAMTSALDYMWIAVGSNFSNAITAAPTNYGNFVTATYNATFNDHKLALATRNLNAASENPGAFTGTANTAGGWTVAVPPAASLLTSSLFVPRNQAVARAYYR